VNHNELIFPIDGFTKSECNIIVSVFEPMSDTPGTGFLRSRHYGAYLVDEVDGWRVKTAYRGIEYDDLLDVIA